MAGHDEEFAAFAASSLADLRRTAYLLCGDWHRAEDAAQEALLRLYRAWRRVERREALLAYARRTTVRILIDESRRPWRRETPVEVAPDVPHPDRSGRVDDRAEMVAALAQLPPRRRACVVLRYYLDLSVAQTATALSCSEGTVKSQTSAALRSLHDVLSEPTGARDG
jgi:RNA polymerase sigma-70 factor (sigma-E family)